MLTLHMTSKIRRNHYLFCGGGKVDAKCCGLVLNRHTVAYWKCHLVAKQWQFSVAVSESQIIRKCEQNKKEKGQLVRLLDLRDLWS